MKINAKLITLSIFLLFILTGCTKKSTVKTDDHHKTTSPDSVVLHAISITEIGLETMRVQTSSLNKITRVPARIITNQDKEAVVGSLVTGRISKVFVKPGDHVNIGQQLMLIEGMEIGTIKADFLKAKANLEYQKTIFERQKLLFELKAGSQKNLFDAQAEFNKAQAEFNAEDKKIHALGLNDADILNGKSDGGMEHISGMLTVKAPIQGIIAERNVIIGQYIDAAYNAFRIINNSSVWVDAQVYEKDIDLVPNNAEIFFIPSVNQNLRIPGKLTSIGQMLDEKSRTITVRAEIQNNNGLLKPQMFGEMQIPSPEKTKGIIIPKDAVINIDNMEYVFVQVNDSTFVKRAIVTAGSLNDAVEITKGLLPNESIVTKGAFYLKSELLKSTLEEEEH